MVYNEPGAGGSGTYVSSDLFTLRVCRFEIYSLPNGRRQGHNGDLPQACVLTLVVATVEA